MCYLKDGYKTLRFILVERRLNTVMDSYAFQHDPKDKCLVHLLCTTMHFIISSVPALLAFSLKCLPNTISSNAWKNSRSLFRVSRDRLYLTSLFSNFQQDIRLGYKAVNLQLLPGILSIQDVALVHLIAFPN